MSTRIKKELKEQILERVTNQGVSVTQVAEEHGITTSAIYKWLERSTESTVPAREHRKVLKENQLLKALVGELTVKLSTSQKRGS
jgi:transposase-like protein